MREILFRGKRVDNSEWAYGYYVHYDDIKDNKKDDTDYIIKKHNGEYFPFEEVISETVGQYTGLTDKNGKKIFEGDIVIDKYDCEKFGFVGVVKYVEERAQFEIKSEKHPDYIANIGARIGSTKVIGNIHDNPELLRI